MKMDVFPVLAIIIVSLFFIIIVVVIIVVATSSTKESPSNGNCTSQNDCSPGTVCTHSENSLTGICKSGLGTSCNTDSDCTDNLYCFTVNNSNTKVCSRQNFATKNITQTNPKSSNNSHPKVFTEAQVHQPTQVTFAAPPGIIHSTTPTQLENNLQVLPINNEQTPMITSSHTRQGLVEKFNSSESRGILPPSFGIKTEQGLSRVFIPKNIVPTTQARVIESEELPIKTDVEVKDSVNNTNIQVIPKMLELDNNYPGFNDGDVRSATPISNDVLLSTDDAIKINRQSKRHVSDDLSTNGLINAQSATLISNDMLESRDNIIKVDTRSATPISDMSRSTDGATKVNTNIANNMSNTNMINGNMINGNISGSNIRRPTNRTVVRKDSKTITPISNNKDINEITGINILKNMGETVTSVKDAMIRNVIPRTAKLIPINNFPQRSIQLEATSPDSEQNSNGDFNDVPFDVRSGDSTEPERQRRNIKNRNIQQHNTHAISTPCQEKDGVYYCRSNKNVMKGNIDHSPVIDVCSYSNATVFLLQDTTIICEIDNSEQSTNNKGQILKNRYKTNNNVSLTRIIAFNGYLHGIGTDQKLYMLPNNYFPTTMWMWKIVEWAPINIKHISSTHDSTHLWIQTPSTGLLYNVPDNVITDVSYNNSNVRRIYGRDIDHYMEIDSVKYTATIYPEGNVLQNVCDGALSYYDEIIAIHPSETKEYRGITIVNWIPYYIRV